MGLINLDLCPLAKFFKIFCVLHFDFFTKSTFSKNSLRNTISVSSSLDPDHTRRFVGSDLGQTVCKSYQQTTLGDKEFIEQSMADILKTRHSTINKDFKGLSKKSKILTINVIKSYLG